MVNAVAGPSRSTRPTRASGTPDAFVPLAGAPKIKLSTSTRVYIHTSDESSDNSQSDEDSDSSSATDKNPTKPKPLKTYTSAARPQTPTKRAPPPASSPPTTPTKLQTPTSSPKKRALGQRVVSASVPLESPKSTKRRVLAPAFLDHDALSESDDELLLADAAGTPKRLALPGTPSSARQALVASPIKAATFSSPTKKSPTKPSR